MDTMLLLFLSGILAGAMNGLAGGGSFVSLPALIAAGVPPVMANASSTLLATTCITLAFFVKTYAPVLLQP